MAPSPRNQPSRKSFEGDDSEPMGGTYPSGTSEIEVYASMDGGGRWTRLQRIALQVTRLLGILARALSRDSSTYCVKIETWYQKLGWKTWKKR